jgi:hypothetical protein
MGSYAFCPRAVSDLPRSRQLERSCREFVPGLNLCRLCKRLAPFVALEQGDLDFLYEGFLHQNIFRSQCLKHTEVKQGTLCSGPRNQKTPPKNLSPNASLLAKCYSSRKLTGFSLVPKFFGREGNWGVLKTFTIPPSSTRAREKRKTLCPDRGNNEK